MATGTERVRELTPCTARWWDARTLLTNIGIDRRAGLE
jgi:hypothetical protein